MLETESALMTPARISWCDTVPAARPDRGRDAVRCDDQRSNAKQKIGVGKLAQAKVAELVGRVSHHNKEHRKEHNRGGCIVTHQPDSYDCSGNCAHDTCDRFDRSRAPAVKR